MIAALKFLYMFRLQKARDMSSHTVTSRSVVLQ